jgi:hypothetical protein
MLRQILIRQDTSKEGPLLRVEVGVWPGCGFELPLLLVEQGKGERGDLLGAGKRARREQRVAVLVSESRGGVRAAVGQPDGFPPDRIAR